MTIELSDEDAMRLFLMMGYAKGAAVHAGDEDLANNFLKLANAVNKDNPRWTPYEVMD